MIKRSILAFSLSLFLAMISGCGDGKTDERINMPSSSEEFEGVNYEDAVTKLQKAGFTNVETKILDDLVTGWLTKDGEVERVSVDGDTDFSEGSKYLPDAKVVVTYHTFPEKSEDSGGDKKDTTQVESDDAKDEQTDNNKVTESTNKEEVTSNPPEIEEDIPKEDQHAEEISAEPTITIENNEDFANILTSGTEVDERYPGFVESHKNEKIEFDGYIAYITPHSTYNPITGKSKEMKTRYDFLLQAGDYVDENTWNPGPSFKMENVGITDLSSENSDFYIGDNVHVVATISDYTPDTGMWFLNFESMSHR